MVRMILTAVFATATMFASALLVLTLYPASAAAQRTVLGEVELCPTRLSDSQDDLLCQCDITTGRADVWGTDIYTSDSMLCHAALHAGAIDYTGGVIHVRRVSGLDEYLGSTRHGMSTRAYGAYASSMVFDGRQSLAGTFGGVSMCPVKYNAAPQEWSGDCRCGPARSGTVWGTNPYTADSAVCNAALHAGVIGRNGGVVRLSPAPGQRSYLGSTRNGVTTSRYGPWDASFRVSAATGQ